jgi:hypothetical protein
MEVEEILMNRRKMHVSYGALKRVVMTRFVDSPFANVSEIETNDVMKGIAEVVGIPVVKLYIDHQQIVHYRLVKRNHPDCIFFPVSVWNFIDAVNASMCSDAFHPYSVPRITKQCAVPFVAIHYGNGNAHAKFELNCKCFRANNWRKQDVVQII